VKVFFFPPCGRNFSSTRSGRKKDFRVPPPRFENLSCAFFVASTIAAAPRRRVHDDSPLARARRGRDARSPSFNAKRSVNRMKSRFEGPGTPCSEQGSSLRENFNGRRAAATACGGRAMTQPAPRALLPENRRRQQAASRPLHLLNPKSHGSEASTEAQTPWPPKNRKQPLRRCAPQQSARIAWVSRSTP